MGLLLKPSQSAFLQPKIILHIKQNLSHDKTNNYIGRIYHPVK